jgi:thiol-disulfide isomerase/thioredoxin
VKDFTDTNLQMNVNGTTVNIPTYGEWCEHCKHHCERREELEEQWAYERHIDLEIKAEKERRLRNDT